MIVTRYVNGVRMLEDLSNNEVTLVEKLFYLLFIFDFFEILEQLLFNTPSSNSAPNTVKFEWVGYVGVLISILVVFFMTKKKQSTYVIERYISLYISATCSSFIVLIPLILICSFVFKMLFSYKIDEVSTDFMIMLYPSIYIVLCMCIWSKRDRSQ